MKFLRITKMNEARLTCFYDFDNICRRLQCKYFSAVSQYTIVEYSILAQPTTNLKQNITSTKYEEGISLIICLQNSST